MWRPSVAGAAQARRTPYSVAGDWSMRACLRRLAALGSVCLVAACAPSAGGPAAGPTGVPAATVASTRVGGTATPAPASSPAPAAEHPAQLLDLTEWKVQLPVNAAGEMTGRYLEVLQPRLRTYASAPHFTVRGDGVQFRAPVNGVTTSGSRYPRSELREMANGGMSMASWSTESGTHTMVVEQAITAVPAVKKHVVAGQIHDGSDDVLTIRLEYPRLLVDHNGVNGPVLTGSYVLGTRFTVKIEAGDGQIKVYYNGSETPADTFPKSGSSNYFKAGAYTQSNCTREARCNTDNYGEVVIYRLEVTHR